MLRPWACNTVVLLCLQSNCEHRLPKTPGEGVDEHAPREPRLRFVFKLWIGANASVREVHERTQHVRHHLCNTLQPTLYTYEHRPGACLSKE